MTHLLNTSLLFSDPRDPRNPGPLRTPQDHDLKPFRRAEEASVHRVRTRQQPSYHVLRRAHVWSGQFLVFPVYFSSEDPGKRGKDDHLHYPPAFGQAV